MQRRRREPAYFASVISRETATVARAAGHRHNGAGPQSAAGERVHLATSRHKPGCVVCSVIAAIAAMVAPASAAKLDDITCDALKLERSRIETDAIKSDMEKGPDWAKSNLSSERLKEIEQLIGLQESIAFRCPLPKPLPPDPNDPNAAAAAGQPPGGAPQNTQPVPAALEDTFSMTPGLSPSLTQSPKKPVPKPPAAVVKPPTAAIDLKPAVPATGAKPAAASDPAVKTAKPATAPAAGTTKAAGATSAISKKPKASDAYVPPPKMGIFPEDQETPETSELAPTP